MTIVWILLALFVTLAILVPLLEKSGPRMSQEDLAKLSRYIPILLVIMGVLGIIRYLFF